MRPRKLTAPSEVPVERRGHMKICVVGAGAIGGYMAVRLADAGHEVAAIARGPHLAAIKSKGLKLVEAEQTLVATDLTATDRIADLGPQDVVLLALKAHQIAAVIDDLSVLLGPDTVLVTLQNGIPWWYFQKLGGEYADRVVAKEYKFDYALNEVNFAESNRFGEGGTINMVRQEKQRRHMVEIYDAYEPAEPAPASDDA